MAAPHPPFPVKLFIALLFRESRFVDEARALFIDRWGPIDFEGTDHPFDVTDYYNDEMGGPQSRRLISFSRLAEPALLIDMKLECNEIEERMSVNGKRVVNCDAGFLDHNKVVLASAKEAGQKIYLGKGIYADLAGRYKDGVYRPFEWSFPDFKDGRYDKELIAIRTLYLTQMKALRSNR